MNSYRRKGLAIAALASTALGTVQISLADAQGDERVARPPVQVVVDGLEGPREFQFRPAGGFVVAEADSGTISEIDPNGARRALLSGLTAPQGVDTAKQVLWTANGEVGPPAEGSAPGAAAAAAGAFPGSSIIRAALNGSNARVAADLQAFELANNPDGQPQFGPDGAPLDALSNPFYVLARPDGGVFVADGGANAVLRVDADGAISTLFVPPLVTSGACAEQPNNDPEQRGCDSVPTGLAFAPENTLLVSTFSAGVPGEGRVYRINANTGRIRETITGFDGPTGVATDSKGTIYVSEVLHGGPPEGEAPTEDLDPASIGRIVRVERNGLRSFAAVPMPVALAVEDGVLYSTAWSLAGAFGMPQAGQIVKVLPEAFDQPSLEQLAAQQSALWADGLIAPFDNALSPAGCEYVQPTPGIFMLPVNTGLGRPPVEVSCTVPSGMSILADLGGLVPFEDNNGLNAGWTIRSTGETLPFTPETLRAICTDVMKRNIVTAPVVTLDGRSMAAQAELVITDPFEYKVPEGAWLLEDDSAELGHPGTLAASYCGYKLLLPALEPGAHRLKARVLGRTITWNLVVQA